MAFIIKPKPKTKYASPPPPPKGVVEAKVVLAACKRAGDTVGEQEVANHISGLYAVRDRKAQAKDNAKLPPKKTTLVF